jgi:hypothetical protein
MYDLGGTRFASASRRMVDKDSPFGPAYLSLCNIRQYCPRKIRDKRSRWNFAVQPVLGKKHPEGVIRCALRTW